MKLLGGNLQFAKLMVGSLRLAYHPIQTHDLIPVFSRLPRQPSGVGLGTGMSRGWIDDKIDCWVPRATNFTVLAAEDAGKSIFFNVLYKEAGMMRCGWVDCEHTISPQEPTSSSL